MIQNYKYEKVQLFISPVVPIWIEKYQLINDPHISWTPEICKVYNKLLSKYCLWPSFYSQACFDESSQIWMESSPLAEQVLLARRTPRIKHIKFNCSLQELIEAVDITPFLKSVIFTGKAKNPNRINASAKQTSYIGVSKNGPHWQSLITIQKKKTYIGTFMTESQAARAYDFYCMLVHCMRAQTNFRYTKQQVFELIDDFKHLIL